MATTRCTVTDCGAELSDVHLCPPHLQYLEDSLAELPWLIEELQTTVTRQDRLNLGVVGKGNETPSVINFGAARLAREVEAILLTWWDRMTIDLKLRATAGVDLEAMRRHAPKVIVWEWAGAFYHEMIRLTGDPDRPSQPGVLLVAINKRTRKFAGPCPTSIGYDDEGRPVECGVTLYAYDGQPEVACPRCKSDIDVANNRRRAVASRDVMLEEQVLETLFALGEPIDRSTLLDWVATKQLKIIGWLHNCAITRDQIRKDDQRLLSLAAARALRAALPESQRAELTAKYLREAQEEVTA